MAATTTTTTVNGAAAVVGGGAATAAQGGVPVAGGALLSCTDDRPPPGLAAWSMGGAHTQTLTAPTLWQYPGKSEERRRTCTKHITLSIHSCLSVFVCTDLVCVCMAEKKRFYFFLSGFRSRDTHTGPVFIYAESLSND